MSPLSATHWRVLDAMRHHGSVTPRDFSRSPTIDAGDEIERLAARVLELREHGYDIHTVMETSPRGKRYARYVLRGEPGRSVAPSAPDDSSSASETDHRAEGATRPPDAPRLFDVPPAVPSPYEDAA